MYYLYCTDLSIISTAVNEHGLFENANSGKLFIRNSTVGGGSTRLTATYRTRFNSIHPGMRHRGVRGAIQVYNS